MHGDFVKAGVARVAHGDQFAFVCRQLIKTLSERPGFISNNRTFVRYMKPGVQ